MVGGSEMICEDVRHTEGRVRARGIFKHWRFVHVFLLYVVGKSVCSSSLSGTQRVGCLSACVVAWLHGSGQSVSRTSLSTFRVAGDWRMDPANPVHCHNPLVMLREALVALNFFLLSQ